MFFAANCRFFAQERSPLPGKMQMTQQLEIDRQMVCRFVKLPLVSIPASTNKRLISCSSVCRPMHTAAPLVCRSSETGPKVSGQFQTGIVTYCQRGNTFSSSFTAAASGGSLFSNENHQPSAHWRFASVVHRPVHGRKLRQPGVNTGNLLCCQRGHDSPATREHIRTAPPSPQGR